MSARVRIGINPLTWTNDDMPELGGETPLETCLAETREAGFEGIELGNKFPRDADALKPILDRYGLALVSGWYSSSLLRHSVQDERASVEGHLTLLKAMGCNAMVFAETSGAVHGDRRLALSTRPTLDDRGWDRLSHNLNRMGAILLEEGLQLAYHHHMGTVIQTEEEIDRLMASTTAEVGLLLDTGHLTFAGGDPARVAKKHGKRIKHVHFKDVRKPVLESALASDQPFLEAVLAGVFTVPGDGMVDYPAVAKALAAADYRGWVVVEAEQDPAKAHPLTYAKLGFANTKRFATGAGLL